MTLRFAVLIIVTEAVSEVLTSSVIFAPLRQFALGKVESRPRWVGILLSCGYCMSVWLGLGAAFMAGSPGLLGFPWVVECLCWGFTIHRLSNLWHAVATFIMKALQGLAIRIFKP